MGDSRRNINLRLPTKPSAKHPPISPYTDRLVEELSSGRSSRADHRRVSPRATDPSTEGEEVWTRLRRKLEDQVKQLTLLVQEKTLRIDDLELRERKMQYQLERVVEEKAELATANLQLAAKARASIAQVQELREKQPSPHVTESVDKYAHFLVHRLKDVPKLLQVYQDRGRAIEDLGHMVGEQNYAGALLCTLQALCDYIVAETRKTDKPPRAGQDREYQRMVTDSDQLLATISAQSQRIAKLNTQLYSTISQQTSKSSARLDHYSNHRTSGKNSPDWDWPRRDLA